MAEDLCFFNKDSLIIKPPKKSPSVLMMVVLVFAMVCSVYICLFCLELIGTRTINNKFLNVQVIDRPSHASVIEQLENPSVHYSIPKTHNRSGIEQREYLYVHHTKAKTYNSSDIEQQKNPYVHHMKAKTYDRSGIEQRENPYVHYPKPKTYNRSECACNPVRFFAILSMQRSGSGWFETLLNSHINVSSNGEIFSVKERRSNVSEILRTMDKLYGLDWLSSASKNECSAAVGFKWMLNQGLMKHHDEIVEYFNRKHVSAIFLFRRNLLRRMISVLANSYDQNAKLLNGIHKSHVHSLHEAGVLARYRPTINATALLLNLKNVKDTAAKALEYFNSTRHFILYYEDVIRNRTKLMDVQEFLGVPQMDLNSRQVKIHNGSLAKHVANWDDVEKILKGTQYESFLQGDYRM